MRHLLYIIALLLLAACKAGKPSGILSEGKMEKILYQYHLMQGMAANSDSSSIKGRAYILACLKANGVSEAEFDSSLVWYYQHMEELQKIYNNIGERLHAELGDAGGADNDVNRYSKLSSTGDTANVWNGRHYYLLSGNGFSNRFTFEIKGDTVFKPGDELMLNFRAQFVQREGTRHAVAALAVQYEGDSVSHTERHVYGSGDFSLTLDAAHRHIKRVYGYIYMVSEWNINPRLLFVFTPSLVRIHKDLPPPQEEAPAVADTAQVKEDTLSKIAVPSSVEPEQMHSRPMPRRMEKIERK
ncbi:MAG: DUF4296 domain-containing protein [Bacteroidaceae bacterium]|nr:DUF4296 domain-containing protein [Bacteroidaceae bacterium]